MLFFHCRNSYSLTKFGSMIKKSLVLLNDFIFISKRTRVRSPSYSVRLQFSKPEVRTYVVVPFSPPLESWQFTPHTDFEEYGSERMGCRMGLICCFQLFQQQLRILELLKLDTYKENTTGLSTTISDDQRPESTPSICSRTILSRASKLDSTFTTAKKFQHTPSNPFVTAWLCWFVRYLFWFW